MLMWERELVCRGRLYLLAVQNFFTEAGSSWKPAEKSTQREGPGSTLLRLASTGIYFDILQHVLSLWAMAIWG